jgi:hypothetical protein
LSKVSFIFKKSPENRQKTPVCLSKNKGKI